MKYENEYPAQFSFQFAAWYSSGHKGSYYAVEDGEAHVKTIGFYYDPHSDGFSFAVTHYPENMGKVKAYAMPYPVVWQSYEGDWQAAAGLYREWGTRQKWCAAGRLSERELPDHVKGPDLWRINHMDYALGARTEEFFNTSLELRDRLNCNLALHWYGWNRREHDFRYPEYMDPENTAWPTELKAWNRRFSDEGILKIPYVNARLWDVNTRSWTEKNAEKSAIRDRDVHIPEEPWNPKTDLKPMCPASSLWQQTVQDFCKQYLMQYGFDGLYIDQIGSYNATLCFDINHPHPVGGGTWWNDSYHAIVRSVRDSVGRQAVLTTESCCETYVDVFDLFLILEQNLQKHYLFTGGTGCDSIPLFNMIYGDYALSYGSLTRFSDTLPEFEFNFVRNLLWGLIPTVQAVDAAQLASPEADKYLAVMKTVVEFYRENKEIFLYGRLAGVLNLNCPMIELTWEMPDRNYTQTKPVVMATLWEDTAGKRSIFMYNFSSEAVMAEEALGTVIGPHALKRVDL